MKLLASLLLLSILTSGGYSIICKSCIDLIGIPCQGPTVSCAAGQICVAAYTESVVGGYTSPQYSITCGVQSDCNVTGSLSFNLGKIRTGTSCCNTDNCTPPIPTLPPVSSQKNGLNCRTCLSNEKDYCYTSETIDCTGQETKCVRMARTLSGKFSLKDAIRGCSTGSFCGILGNQKTTLDGLNVDMKTFCSDGAVGLSTGLFYSLAALLLAKLLF